MIGRDAELDRADRRLRRHRRRRCRASSSSAARPASASPGCSRNSARPRRRRRRASSPVSASSSARSGSPTSRWPAYSAAWPAAFGAGRRDRGGRGGPARPCAAMIEGAPPAERDERMGIERLDEVVTTLLERLSAERPARRHHRRPALGRRRDARRAPLRGPGACSAAAAARADLPHRRRRARPPAARRSSPSWNATAARARIIARAAALRLRCSAQARELLGATPSTEQARDALRAQRGRPVLRRGTASGSTAPATGRRCPRPCASSCSAATRSSSPRHSRSSGSSPRAERARRPRGARPRSPACRRTTSRPRSGRQSTPACSSSTGRGYDFRHALVREAVASELLPGESSRIHTGYAQALASRTGDPTQRPRAPCSSRTTGWRRTTSTRRSAASLEGTRLSRAAFAYTSAAQLGERALSTLGPRRRSRGGRRS